MVAPLPIYRRTLTGNIRGRRNWLNQVLMQVEVRCERLSLPWANPPSEVLSTHFEWRDATVDDLIDRRYTPIAPQVEP